MIGGRYSLHDLVDKWLSPIPAESIRIIRLGRSRSNQRPHVRIETTRPNGVVAIIFFRHDDGSWYVFPPPAARPAIGG